MELLKPLETREVKDYKLFPESVEPGFNTEYASDKADKLSLALGDANPGTDVLTSDIAGGQQRQWLEVVKNTEENSTLNRRNEIVQSIAQNRPKGQPITFEEINVVGNLTNDELYAEDVGTILEKKYSDMFLNTLASNEEAVVATDALEEDESAAMDEMDRASFPMQRIQSSEDVFQEIKTKYDASSWSSWGADMAKSVLIPGYDTLKGRERIETPTSSWLLGNNQEEQISQLYSLPPAEFKKTLKEIVDDLAKDNLVAALDFASNVRSYSQSDKGWASLGTVADVAGVTGTISSAGKLAKGLRTAAKAVTMSPRKIADIAAVTGLNKQASISRVSKDILAGDLTGVTTISRIEELGDRLPTLLSPNKVLSRVSSNSVPRLDAEAAMRVRVAIQRNADEVLKVIGNGNLVDRLEPSQVIKAVTKASDEVKNLFPSNVSNIIDTEVVPAALDKVTNTAVLVTRFGKRDGTMFASEASAKNFAKRYIGIKTDDFKIDQNGVGGYFIEVRKPIADVGDWRRTEIEGELSTPNTLDGAISRALRSPDYLLSNTQTMARGRVVHTSEYISSILDDATKPFRGKSNEWYSEMDAMFRKSRTDQKYAKDIGEFETDFYKKFSKVPSEDQVEAYFLYRQLNELDYMIRDADKVKKYTAKGFSNFSTSIVKKDGDAAEDVTFIGRTVDTLPPTDRFYRVQIVESGKKVRMMTSQSKNWAKNKELIDNLLTQGYKIVEHGEEPTYSIIKGYKQNSIKMRTLGYKEGGHFDPKYGFYISQGDFDDIDTAKIFKGDKNLATSPTEKQAKEVASLFDKARLMIKNSDPLAKKFIDDNLPISYGEFIKKIKAGSIKLDVPILSRKSGQTTAETFKYESIMPTFQDYRHSEYNPLADTTVKYGTERADELLDVWTHEDGKIVKQNWEPLMSPMDALSSATKNMINVRVFEDYAMKSANDWVQEFGHMMDVPTETLKANPRYYLQNPKYRSGIGNDRAEAARMAMLSIFDQLDQFDVSRLAFRDKVLNKMFDIRLDKAAEFNPGKVYSATDVQQFVRKAAFHMKLGLWNPKHLFLQSSAVAQAVAISPRAAWKASEVLTQTRLALMTGNTNVELGLFNKLGKKSTWDKQDWIDMVRSFKQSGLATIGGDTAYLDELNATNIAANKFGRLRESMIGKMAKTNTFFFNEGELTSRIMAYTTAWTEFKTANPGKAIDRFAESKILQRAKDMTTNMTRESNSRWQKGWGSVFTQFWGYQARVSEQMWDGGLLKDGKKLTKNEKLRLMAMMSTLYGAGTTTTMYTAFNVPLTPNGAQIREWMKEAGWDQEDNPLIDTFVDGAPSALVKATLGADVDLSSYGPTGLPTLMDLMNEDKSWGDTLMGAGPGVVADVGSSIWGAAIAMGYSEGSLSQDDILGVMRNISSVDAATKAYLAVNAGRYISKKGNYITDVSATEGLMSAILGVQPGAVSDTYLQMKLNKDFKKGRSEGSKAYKDASIKAVRALEAGDHDAYLLYRKRRDAIGILYDLSLSEKARVAKETFTDSSLSDFVAEDAARIEMKYKTFTGESD